MTYKALAEMYQSQSLRDRIIAAAAEEGIVQPDVRIPQYMWKICARSDWKAAWQAAGENYTTVYNPETGARPDVITDQMILGVVQSLKPEINGPTPAAGDPIADPQQILTVEDRKAARRAESAARKNPPGP